MSAVGKALTVLIVSGLNMKIADVAATVFAAAANASANAVLCAYALRISQRNNPALSVAAKTAAYTVCSAGGAVSAAVGTAIYGFTAPALFCSLSVAILCAAGVSDAVSMEIPERFNAALLLVSVSTVIFAPRAGIWEYAAGLIAVPLALILLDMLAEGSFGGGDIKMLAASGLGLGVKLSLVAFMLSLLSCAVFYFAIFIINTVRIKRRGNAGCGAIEPKERGLKQKRIPFAPFIATATAVAYYAGDAIIAAYLKFF